MREWVHERIFIVYLKTLNTAHGISALLHVHLIGHGHGYKCRGIDADDTRNDIITFWWIRNR